MKNRHHILILLAFFLHSCSLVSDYTLGDRAERRLTLPANFDKIDIKGSFSVTLIQDTVGFAVINCYDKLMSDVDVSIRDNVLFLRENVKNRWLKDYPIIDIELHLATINMIEIYQPCKLTIPNTFKCHSFKLIDWGNYVDLNVNIDVDILLLDVSGWNFGTYYVMGKAEFATLSARGTALFNLSQTQIKYCTVNQGSVVDMHIWVTDKLDATITSSGNILLQGDPQIELNRKGVGDLKRVP